MADKKKNAHAFTKDHPEISLYIELNPGGRKNQNKKKVDPNPTRIPRGSVSAHSQYNHVTKKESPSKFFES